MTSQPATYTPGEGTAIVGPGAVALVEASAASEVVRRLSARVEDGCDLKTLAGELIDVGINSLPALACALHSDGEVALLLRGDVRALLERDGEPEEILSGSAMATWREEHRSGVVSVTLALGAVAHDADAEPSQSHAAELFSMHQGTAPAKTLRRVLTGDDERIAAADDGAAANGRSGLPRGLGPDDSSAPVALPPENAAGAGAPSEAADDAAVPRVPAGESAASNGSDAGRTPESDSLPPPPAAPAPPPPSAASDGPQILISPLPSDDDEEFEFGHLLGHTRYREVEQAAVRQEAGDEVQDDVPPDADAPASGSSAKEAEPQATPLPPLLAKFCESCGRARTAAEAFCEGCGNPFPLDGPRAGGERDALAEATQIFVDAPVPAAAAPMAEELPPPPTSAPSSPLPPPPGPVGTSPPAVGHGLIQGIPGLPVPPPPATSPPGPPPTAPAPSGAPPRPFVAPSTIVPPSSLPPPSAPPPQQSTYFSQPIPATPATPAPGVEYEEEPTMSVAAFRAEQDQRAAANAGPLLQAVLCPAGHPSPPHVDTCRECGAPISDRSVVTVPRPPLGWLAFSDGQEIRLERSVVVGRNPASDQLVAGERADVVRLADPDKLLSRTHAEIRLVDWQVHVVDRESMNHTFVQLPGRAPMQLRPAEACPIPPGTLVNLGDVASFVFRVAPL